MDRARVESAPPDRSRASAEIPALLQHHFDELHAGSGLAVDVIKEQGYRSVWGPHDLRGYGFSDTQLRGFPALVLPIHPPDGTTGTAVLKPDTPRTERTPAGTEHRIKYEWPAGTPLRLDVPVRCSPRLADPNVTLGVTEGNKKAAAGAQHGFCMVSLNGVWGWREKHGPLADFDRIPLAGRHVFVCFDSFVMVKPDVGKALAAFRAFLERRGAVVSLAHLPHQPDGSEMKLDDFLLTHTADDFRALIGKLPAGPDGVSPLHPLSVRPSWPFPPGKAVYTGLAGDVVRLVHGCTEADPVGILTTFVVKFAAMVGRGPYTMVGPRRHQLVEFSLLVGETAKARKGDSQSPVDLVLDHVTSGWGKANTKSGLSTGEGIIHDLRDPTENDPGEDDRRRLYVETEFVRVLRASQRQGNTLSPVLRQLWDSDALSSLTKGCPEVASMGHGAVLAHTTASELRQEGGEAELHTGLLNRFLCPVVKRSGIIASPDAPDGDQAKDIARRLQARLEDIHTAGALRVEFSPAARRLWSKLYREMTRELQGAVGAAMARLDAHCVRLSRLYALSDPTAPITRGRPGQPGVVLAYPRHLEAAAEYCRYLRRSAYYLYGDTTGNPLLDTILEYLKENGDATLTDIQNGALGKNSKATLFRPALALGVSLGRIKERRSVGASGGVGGRPPTVYGRTDNGCNGETPTEGEIRAEGAETRRAEQAEEACEDYVNDLMWQPVLAGVGLWADPPADDPPAPVVAPVPEPEPAAAIAEEEAEDVWIL